MKKNVVFLLSVMVLSVVFATGFETQVCSPDGRNEIKLYLKPLAYEVKRDGVTLVEKSPISLSIVGSTLGEGVSLSKNAQVSCGEYSGIVETPIYKRDKVDLSAKWAFADFGDWGVRIVARNDGVAYRFETKKITSIKVTGENVTLKLPDPAAKCWTCITDKFGCEEVPHKTLLAKDIATPNKKMIYLPFVYSVGGKMVAVTDSDVKDYPVLYFKRSKDEGAVFESYFSKWPKKTTHVTNIDGWGKHKDIESGGRWVRIVQESDYLVETEGKRTFPWRTFVLTDEKDASSLPTADIVWALARPAQKDHDFSWVKPGKVAWDWWNAFDNLGYNGCTTKTYERFIDFAAKNGVEYVIFDEGWSEHLNVWKYSPKVDVPYLVDYANKKGVGIILWIAWAQAVNDEARVVEYFAKLKIKGFKVDFMDRGDAQCEQFLWKFAEECRKAKLMVDYHGVHRPTGMCRAYPNVVNFEANHGLENMKWFRNNYDFMDNDIGTYYLRMTAGALDYTPGAMDNVAIGKYKGHTVNPGSVGTRSRQMALLAIYEAPLQMLCDSPTKYEKNMECFRFMASIPVVWSESVALGGHPDTYVAIARKSKDGAWYAAAISNSQAREIEIDTSKFLEKGDWQAEIFRDTLDGDVNPAKYIHETKSVKSGEKISFKTAPGGGYVIKFTKR